jgi:hypothetical protein
MLCPSFAIRVNGFWKIKALARRTRAGAFSCQLLSSRRGSNWRREHSAKSGPRSTFKLLRRMGKRLLFEAHPRLTQR